MKWLSQPGLLTRRDRRWLEVLYRDNPDGRDLFRYLDEQAYRFNNRHLTDEERMDLAVRGIVGKRIMFDQLTGKVGPEA